MKKILYATVIALLGVICLPDFSLAQQQKEDNQDQSYQEIIIRRKGDHSKKITVQIDGDKVLINGRKPGAVKGGDISVTQREVTSMDDAGGFIKNFRPRGGLQMFDTPGKWNANKALLGVVTENEGDKGARVTWIQPGSAADSTGLQKGDVITQVGKNNILSPEDLVKAVGKYSPGDQVTITYQRDGKAQTTTVKLGENNEEAFIGRSNSAPFGRSFGHSFRMFPGNGNGNFNWLEDDRRPRLGATIQNQKDGQGVVVVNVLSGSAAEKAGLKTDDIITELAGKKINSAQEVINGLDEVKDQDNISLTILRDGKQKTLTVTLTHPRPMINL